MSDSRKLGEIAYNGYYERAGGKTWNGYAMLLWADLPANVQFAWQAGAEAVAQAVIAEREAHPFVTVIDP